ncbi:protein kinase [Acidimicrobium ferrooxidans]|nr:protein kinase [Acidimicrobium ferrooxidans]
MTVMDRIATITELLRHYSEDETRTALSEAFLADWSATPHDAEEDPIALLESGGYIGGQSATRIREILDTIDEAEITPSRLIDGRYALGQVLGQGGQGMVYQARDLYLNRDVALKRLTRLGDAGTQRMMQEARNLYKVSHPNIVRELGFGICRGTEEPYLVLEFLQGPTFEQWLKLQELDRIPAAQAVQLLSPIADALGQLHRAGIVHRDLKPGNLILARRDSETPDSLILIDFGGVHDESVALTQTGVVIGTARYMSPEAAEAGKITPATDIYGMGGLLYRALTGFAPHQGQTQAGCINKLLRGDIEAPRKRIPSLDRGIEEIILKCMSLDPARRYKDGGALHLELERYLEGQALEVRPPGPVGRLGRWLAVHRRDQRAMLLEAACLLLVLFALGATLVQGQLDQSAAQATFRETHGRTLERMKALFDSARICMRRLRREANRGELPLDRAPFRRADAGADTQAERLIEHLGDNPALSWITYSSNRGDFIGAYRIPPAQQIWVNKSYLTPQDGTQVHHYRVNGAIRQLTDAPPVESAKDYDPRKRPFFKLATSAHGIHWTEPYAFWEGFPGITCTSAVRDRQGAVTGVLTVDLEIWQLSKALASNGAVVVLYTPRGHVVSLSRKTVITKPQQLTLGEGNTARLVTVEEIPDPLVRAFAAARKAGGQQFRFAHAGQRYRASVHPTETAGLPLVIGIILAENAPAATHPSHQLLQWIYWICLAIAAMLFLLALERVLR